MQTDVDIEQDFLEFFGKPRSEILKKIFEYPDANSMKRELFPLKNISLEKLYDIIKNSYYYTTMLTAIGNNWFQSILDFDNYEEVSPVGLISDVNKEKENIKILDYGCGAAKYGLNLALKGYDVTLADIPHPHFQFMKFLCEKYNVKVKFYDVPCSNEMVFPEKYDYIINTEVMEHCDEPVMVLKSLNDAMKDDGIMFLSTFFNDCDGDDPSHLRKNTIRYEEVAKWWIEVEKIGLYCYKKDPRGVEKGFKKR